MYQAAIVGTFKRSTTVFTERIYLGHVKLPVLCCFQHSLDKKCPKLVFLCDDEEETVFRVSASTPREFSVSRRCRSLGRRQASLYQPPKVQNPGLEGGLERFNLSSASVQAPPVLNDVVRRHMQCLI